VSAALGKIMPGGAQALNNPATREAAKKSFGTVLKSALKGAAEEIPQEVIDGGFNHIATEMAKGKTFNEAATSYAEQHGGKCDRPFACFLLWLLLEKALSGIAIASISAEKLTLIS